MKKLIIGLCLSLFVSGFVFAAAEAGSEYMAIDSFVAKLVEQFGLADSLKEDATYEDSKEVLPEAIQEQLQNVDKDNYVSRIFLAEILSSYLDPNEISELVTSGEESDILEIAEINEIFTKCSYDDSGVLTYLKAPKYGFKESLNVRNPDIPQVEGERASISGGASDQ